MASSPALVLATLTAAGCTEVALASYCRRLPAAFVLSLHCLLSYVVPFLAFGEENVAVLAYWAFAFSLHYPLRLAELVLNPGRFAPALAPGGGRGKDEGKSGGPLFSSWASLAVSHVLLYYPADAAMRLGPADAGAAPLLAVAAEGSGHAAVLLAARTFAKETAAFDPDASLPWEVGVPFLARSALFAVLMLCGLQLIGVLLNAFARGALGVRFPRVNNSPWAAASVREFWAVRWNSVYQQLLARYCARPVLSAGLGKTAATLATFAASGVIHAVPLVMVTAPAARGRGVAWGAALSVWTYFFTQFAGCTLDYALFGGSSGKARAATNGKVNKKEGGSFWALVRWVLAVSTLLLPLPLLAEPVFEMQIRGAR